MGSEDSIRTEGYRQAMSTNLIRVIGPGRAGSTIAARLRERGGRVVLAREPGPGDVVLLAVPDRAIAEVAASVEPGPWVGHLSGATTLEALAPHGERRFALHPLMTFRGDADPGQLDGAFAAIGGASPAAVGLARELSALLGVTPFELAERDRARYHAAACIAGNFLSTIYATATRLDESIGFCDAKRALYPLMRATLENARADARGFALTGPIARGDGATVAAHLAALADDPGAVELYRVLARATEELSRS